MNISSQFGRFLRPASVVIVGASPQRGSPRNTVVRNLIKHGYAGQVYPVSQSHEEIEGLRAYRSIAETPEVPDLALVITPASSVPGVISECGRRGIRNAIVFSSGFEEVGEAGKGIALRMKAAALEHGVMVMGPNCTGIWSTRSKTMLTFSPGVLNADHLLHGPVAIISQSGALAGAIGNALQTAGVGYSYVVTVGNETCLDALEALECIVEQSDVRAVALYVEGLRDATRILAIAQRARERGVSIVVLKSGRSAIGQQATASHTGKIASPFAVYAGALRQGGIFCVDTLRETVNCVEALATLPHPRQGKGAHSGVAVMTSSGGAGALLADHGSALAVPMAEFGPATAKRLQAVLPNFARAENPIDLTGQINTDPELFRKACEAVSDDPRVEAVLIQFASSGRRYLEKNGGIFKEIATRTPVIIGFIGELPDAQVRTEYREAGVLMCPDPSDSMQAMSWLYQRREAQSLPALTTRASLGRREAPQGWAASMQFLEDAGIVPAPWVVLAPADRAERSLGHLRFPVAVKVLPSDAEHKTELGLVRLNLRSPVEVDECAAEFRQLMAKPHAGILVQEMIGGGVEVVVSCLRDPDFGPVLSIGSGGVAVELYKDIAHLALPVTEEQVIAALRRLPLWTLLRGFRGKPDADVPALAAAAVKLGDLFIATPGLREIEINPVMVLPQGKSIAAVDVLCVADAHIAPPGVPINQEKTR